MKYKIPKTRILFKIDEYGKHTYFPQFKDILFWKNIIYNHKVAICISNCSFYGYKEIYDAEKYIDSFIGHLNLLNSYSTFINEGSIEYIANQK